MVQAPPPEPPAIIRTINEVMQQDAAQIRAEQELAQARQRQEELARQTAIENARRNAQTQQY